MTGIEVPDSSWFFVELSSVRCAHVELIGCILTTGQVIATGIPSVQFNAHEVCTQQFNILRSRILNSSTRATLR